VARIAPPLVVALVIVILGLLLWLQASRHDAATASAQAGLLQDTNNALAASLGELERERARHERHAADVMDRAEQGQQKLAAVSRELKELKATHETLRAYLDSLVPLGVERVLFHAPGDGAGYPRSTTGFPAEGDAQAAAPGSITHEEGWSYCAGLDVAIDKCNGDKAALRAWKEGK